MVSRLGPGSPCPAGAASFSAWDAHTAGSGEGWQAGVSSGVLAQLLTVMEAGPCFSPCSFLGLGVSIEFFLES